LESQTNKLERLTQLVKPEKILKIKLNQQQGTDSYNPIGGIVHKGGAGFGHCLSVINTSNNWYEINDENVALISETEVIQLLESNGVLLLYQKDQNHQKRNNLLKQKNTLDNEDWTNQKGPQKHHDNTGETVRKEQIALKKQEPNFFRFSRRKKFIKRKRNQWTKIYLEKGKRHFYDPDKKCFYTPRV